MDYFQAIILSIVEGITEFLPISSTGHLILVGHLLGIPPTSFVKTFNVFVQFGAILAVVHIYLKILLTDRRLWKKLLVAFLPTAIVGFALYSSIVTFLLGNPYVTVAALFIGGIALILVEIIHKEKPDAIESIDTISMKQAFLIGLFQIVAMVPGVSRAATTIFGGLFVGLKRKTAVEFSFLLAAPTMIAATALDLAESRLDFSGQEIMILTIGFIGSFITAYFTVKYLLRFVQHHTFIGFGIYRIILAVTFWLFILT